MTPQEAETEFCRRWPDYRITATTWHRDPRPGRSHCTITGKHPELADGGTNRIDNLIAVCRGCHDWIHRRKTPAAETARGWQSAAAREIADALRAQAEHP